MANGYRMPPLQNRYSGVTEALAECDVCDFQATNRKNALALASQHARRTGHQVHATQVLSIVYNKTEGTPHRYRVT